MYHILPAERQRQCGSFRWQYQRLSGFLVLGGADAPGLVQLGRAVRAGIGGMEQQVDLAAAGGDLDLLAAGQQRSRARLEAEPIERGLAQRGLDPVSQIGRNGELAGLERAR